MPAHLLFPLIFSVLFYNLAQLRQDAVSFWSFAGITMLISQCAAGLGLMIGCLVPTPELATSLAPVFLIPLIIVGGLLANTDSLKGFVWLEAISPIHYAYEGGIVTEFKGRSWTYNVSRIDPLTRVRTDITVETTGEEEIARLGMSEDDFTRDLVMLVVLAVIFRVVALLFLYLRVYFKNASARKNKELILKARQGLTASHEPGEKV